MEQAEYRMPATGEIWQHHKGELYTVIGIATLETTLRQLVLLTPYDWGLSQLPPIRAVPLDDFLAEVEFPIRYFNGEEAERSFLYRFAGMKDARCPFIRDQTSSEGVSPPRGADMAEAQTWGTEVETAITRIIGKGWQ